MRTHRLRATLNIVCAAVLIGSVYTQQIYANSLDNDAEQTAISRDAVRSLEAYAVYKAGDYQEARRIWEELAARGNTTAMINLANLFESGQGVSADQLKAFEYIRNAAELGDSRAEYELGIAYKKGHLVERDTATASYWLERSARGGDMDGQFAWGVMLAAARGKGIQAASKKQKAAAFSWLRKAQEQGHTEAAKFVKLLE